MILPVRSQDVDCAIVCEVLQSWSCDKSDWVKLCQYVCGMSSQKLSWSFCKEEKFSAWVSIQLEHGNNSKVEAKVEGNLKPTQSKVYKVVANDNRNMYKIFPNIENNIHDTHHLKRIVFGTYCWWWNGLSWNSTVVNFLSRYTEVGCAISTGGTIFFLTVILSDFV